MKTMKAMKATIAACAAALMLAAASFPVFAASSYTTPAEAAAGVTGKTVERVISERQENGKTYGTIAKEAGKLEEFKAEVLKIKKEAFAALVADGKLTQEEADAILKALEENQAACDGTGSGCGQGIGRISRGTGMGRRAGCGLNQDACLYQ